VGKPTIHYAVAVYSIRDVMTDVISSGSTIREDHLDAQHRRTLW